MKVAFGRLACCVGLFVALGALCRVAQEEIPFESEPKANPKTAPAATDTQPNPFVPEEAKHDQDVTDETSPAPSRDGHAACRGLVPRR